MLIDKLIINCIINMKPSLNQELWQNEEESGSSRQQWRVLEEGIQKDEKLSQINNQIGDELLISNSAKILEFSTNNIHAANLLDPLPQGLSVGDIEGNNELSVATILSLVERGTDEEELEQMLEQAITSIQRKIVKDKAAAKKHLSQLLTLMAVLERTLRQSHKQPELQNALRHMQQKVSNLAKDGNIENVQQFLKSAELKKALKSSIDTALKQPENFRNMADNVSTRIRETQKNATLQNQNQIKQPIEQKPNPLSQLMNRMLDKGREPNPLSQLMNRMLDKGREMLTTAKQPNIADHAKLQVQQPAAQTNIVQRQTAQVQQQTHVTQTAATTIQNTRSSIVANTNIQINQSQNLMSNVRPTLETKPRENVVTTPQNTVSIKSQQIQQTQTQGVKPEVKSPTAQDKPPTSGHVHSGNCCGVNKQNVIAANEAAQKFTQNIDSVKQAVQSKVETSQLQKLDQSLRNSAQDQKRAQDSYNNLSGGTKNVLGSLGI